MGAQETTDTITLQRLKTVARTKLRMFHTAATSTFSLDFFFASMMDDFEVEGDDTVQAGRVIGVQHLHKTGLHPIGLYYVRSSVISLWRVLTTSSCVMFEASYTSEGAGLITSYYFAAVAFYSTFDRLLMLLCYLLSSWCSADVVMTAVMVIALIAVSLNGYVWAWLRKDTYYSVKFEMYNRYVRGYRDAKLLVALKGTTMSCMVDVMGFYGAYIGAAYWYERLITQLFVTPLEVWYMTFDRLVAEIRGPMITESACGTCDMHPDELGSRAF